MHIPTWFTFRKKSHPPTRTVLPEIIGPMDKIPPHHQNIMTRDDWGAEPPYRPKPTLVHPIQFIKFTYTTYGPRCHNTKFCIKAVRDLQLQHVNMAGIDDIQYNFLIGGDAKVYEGRGWHSVPENERAYLNPWQGKFLEIAFIGDDKGFKIPPTYAMFKAVWQLLQHGIDNKFISLHYKML